MKSEETDDPERESEQEKSDARQKLRELEELDPNAEEEARKVERQLRRLRRETSG